jgi:hypothetical protein
MEDTSLYSGSAAGSYGAHQQKRLASDARNLVREAFPRQLHIVAIAATAWGRLPHWTSASIQTASACRQGAGAPNDRLVGRARDASRRQAPGQNCRKLLALCYDCLRLCAAGHAVQRVEVTDQRRGLCSGCLYFEPQRHHRGRRYDGRANILCFSSRASHPHDCNIASDRWSKNLSCAWRCISIT